ncbi:MAG: YihY/virulence factor BrkB family protein [Ekhidna sp.]|nr:YihY/virulence factor BrkB family protein [Ekhidna sp.]
MVKKYFDQITHFIEVDLWRLRLNRFSGRRRLFYGALRVTVISFKEFVKDRCMEKASALTYFSMLSLVPVLAMAIAIAKAFGLRQLMEDQLSKYFEGQDKILDNVLPAVDNMLNSSGSGIVTGVSVVFLIFTVIRLLINIEAAFNDMWDIKKSRRWERKISDYVAVILLGPVLLIVASSATVFVKDTIQHFVAGIEFLGQLKSGIFFLLKLLPYTILWLLLFGLYLIFPNIRVKVLPAIVAGIIAGTLYQLNQQAFISLQFAFASYDAIYGSIAFIPLFLIWLQISWLIVLFGAEVCYAIQFVNQWEMDSDKLKVNLSHRRKLVLLLLYRIIKRFEDEGGALSLSELSRMINIPRRYLTELCCALERSKLIVRTEGEEGSYLPGFDIHKMDIHTILSKYETEGIGEFDSNKSKPFQNIEKALDEIEEKWKGSDKNVLLKNL